MSNTGKNGKLSYAYELYIAAPAAKVWARLFERAVPLPFMFETKLVGTLRKDTPYSYVGDGEFSVVDGRVLEVQPGLKMVMTWSAHWGEAENNDRPSRVTYELTTIGPKVTKLRVVHDDFDGETATYVASTASWPRMLSSLKSGVETGTAMAVA
ncbi:MAG TPA: SRPBCC domain-containing protein [Gemmatimonadales bacterium]|nr:SRPBCC domain-containing protein [Gemmatimonadales bacterium]